VADAVHHGVDEDGLAGGDELAHGDGVKFERLGPVEGRIFEQRTQDGDGLRVSRENLVGAAVGDGGVVGLRQCGETLRIPEFDGNDVLQELANGLSATDVAGDSEGLRMCDEERVALLRGGLVQASRSSPLRVSWFTRSPFVVRARRCRGDTACRRS
jgi:hypothetical protein